MSIHSIKGIKSKLSGRIQSSKSNVQWIVQYII